jgi:hypothetical protein
MAQFKPHSLLTGISTKREFIPAAIPVVSHGTCSPLPWGSSVEERGTHNPEVGGATPPPASLIILNPNLIPGYN